MLYCPNFFWTVLQVWMTGKDVYLQITWSWPDKTWNILCSYCLQWNTSQSKFRNHYFLFLFAFSILSQLFLIWGCTIMIFNRSVILLRIEGGSLGVIHGMLKVICSFTLLNLLLMIDGWRVSEIISPHCTHLIVFENVYYCFHGANLLLTVYSVNGS